MAGPGEVKRGGRPIVRESAREAERFRQFLITDLKPRETRGASSDSRPGSAEDIVLGETDHFPFLLVNKRSGTTPFDEVSAVYPIENKTVGSEAQSDVVLVSGAREMFADKTTALSVEDITVVYPGTKPAELATDHLNFSEKNIIFLSGGGRNASAVSHAGGLLVFPSPGTPRPGEAMAAFAPGDTDLANAARANQTSAADFIFNTVAAAQRVNADFGTNLYSPPTLSSPTGMTLSAPQGHAVGLAYQSKAWMRRQGSKGGGFQDVKLVRETNAQGTTAYVISGTRNGAPLSIRIQVRPKVTPGYYAPLAHDMKKPVGELTREMDELSSRYEDKIEATYKAMDPAELSPTAEQALALRARTAMRTFRNQVKQFERQNRDLQRKIDKLRASGVPTRAQQEEIDIAEGQIMRNQERLILYLDVVRAYHHLNG